MIESKVPKSITDFPMAENDLRVAFEAYRQGILRTLDICFPACVYQYDRLTNEAVVMPLVKQAFFYGEWHYIRRQPFKVSVRRVRCGGFTIDFPLFKGDTGWVFSSDRDTLLLKEDGALTNSVLIEDRAEVMLEEDYQQKPQQPILHALNRGFFLPDNWGSFEKDRYKDNPDFPIGAALYIGASIDTDDRRDDTDERTYQHGDQYELSPSASLAISPGGAITMAASGATEVPEDREEEERVLKHDAHVSVYEDMAEVQARGEGHTASVVVHEEEGIIIRNDRYKEVVLDDAGEPTADFHMVDKHFICQILPDSCLVRVKDSDKVVSVLFSNGELNIQTASDLNVLVEGEANFKCSNAINIAGGQEINVQTNGKLNVKAGEAHVSAERAHVMGAHGASVVSRGVVSVVGGGVNINAAEHVNIGSASFMRINSGRHIDIAARDDATILAGRNLNVETGQSLNLTSRGGSIWIDAASDGGDVGITARGSIKLFSNAADKGINIAALGENSPITINSHKSSIFLGAFGDIDISSSKKVSIHGENVHIGASKELDLYGGNSANLTGQTLSLNAHSVVVDGERLLKDKYDAYHISDDFDYRDMMEEASGKVAQQLYKDRKEWEAFEARVKEEEEKFQKEKEKAEKEIVDEQKRLAEESKKRREAAERKRQEELKRQEEDSKR